MSFYFDKLTVEVSNQDLVRTWLFVDVTVFSIRFHVGVKTFARFDEMCTKEVLQQSMVFPLHTK